MFRHILRPIFSASTRHAGHSKWANIKHDKGLKDAARGQLFTKLGRMMKVAIQEGGSIDPKMNLKLEQVIEQAKRACMPHATMQSIIKSTQTDKTQCKSYMLEIKGPGSCMILLEVFTDNLHHMRQSVATILKKHNAKYLDSGGLKHFFSQKGIIEADLPETTEDILEKATEHAIEAGAEDVELVEDRLMFMCGESNLKSVIGGLEKLNYKISSGSVEYIALSPLQLSEDDMAQYGKLYGKLEGLPETIKVSDNVA